MWISDFSISKPIVTIVLMLALVIFGVGALISLDTDEFPEVNPPVVALALVYPGAGPETVEREVVDPIEDAIAGISGVKKLSSTSLDSFGQIVVEFDFEKDIQQATQDIRDKISETRQDLPAELEEPLITRFDPQDFPIMSITLSSDGLSSAELTKLADPGITRELQSLAGVARVEVVGGVQPELLVELHPDRLEALGVGVNQVVGALQFANLAAPVGRVTAEREERTIRLSGHLMKPEEFGAIALYGSGGRLVRLDEVATVSVGTEEPRSLAFFNGQQAVGINLVKATNASTTAVAERVAERLDRIRERLPAGVTLTVVRDSGERVANSVSNVKRTLFEGAVLTVLVVFAFLTSWRSTVITGLALPVSVLASFVAVWAFGFTLNTMSLLGLSLAIGILVDDAIVVRENIVRHMEMGKDHMTAAREGTAEIGLAVAATTISIVVVFVPVAFMGGVSEQWLGPMALTIASSVAVSLLVSFSLDPMLSAYWPDPVLEQGQKSAVVRALDRFNLWLERQTERYRQLIRWALGHRVAMFAIATLSFFGALALPATGAIGSGLFPETDNSEFQIVLRMPPGSSLEYSRAKVEEALAFAAAEPEVRYTYATVGTNTGAVDEASVYVRLTPKADRDRGQNDLINAILPKMDALAGVEASVTGGMGPMKQIQLQLRGPDINVLSELAEGVMAEVKQVPGAVDVGLSTRGQRPELEVTVDRELASTLGFSVGAVAQAVRPAFAGLDVGDWVDPSGETRVVRVRLSPEARQRAADLAGMPLVIQGPMGTRSVPLGQIAEVRPANGPAAIQHLNRERVITVEANARGLPLSAVSAGIQERIDGFAFPPGYGVVQGGQVEQQAEVFGRTLGALGVAILLMYFILVVQFGSFLEPIAIMASLPLSLIGVMLALLLTGSTLNLMSMIGITLLFGIVAKNAILLVDFAKWAEERGVPRKEAIIEAGGTRLRPILMTSVAIIAGMVPVALGLGEGADFRAPLGRAVIGGVITSTLLTLLVIPTFYDTITSARDWVWRRLFGERKAHHGEEAPNPAK